MTTESWLNAKAPPSERGRVFSIYMVGKFLALAIGQLLIGSAEIQTGAPYNAIVTLFATALVMVTTTRAEPPQATATERLPYGQLSAPHPSQLLCCSVASSPVPFTHWFQHGCRTWALNADVSRCSCLWPSSAVRFQIPIGWLSDRFDRRVVLAALGLGFAGTAVALVRIPHSFPVVASTAVLLGGFMSTFYPVCVAHAHDRMPVTES